MKFTSLTLIIAAIAGTGFSQAAYASDEKGSNRGMRFDYAPNEFPLELPTGHHGGRYAAPHTVVSAIPAGAVSKMSLPADLVSKPAPLPVVAAKVMPNMQTAAKVLPSSFNSLFGQPKQTEPALVASNPGLLPAFGRPNALKAPPAAAMPKAPIHASSNLNGVLLTPQHRHVQVAQAAAPAFRLPQIKSVGSGYSVGATLPTATGAGTSTSASVQGVLIKR